MRRAPRLAGWLRLLVVVTVIVATVVVASLTPRGQRWWTHEYQSLSFQWIANQVTRGADDSTTAVVRLLSYVHDQMQPPPEGKVPGDVEAVELLSSGVGYCDQQSNVLIQLARRNPGVGGRLVFLRNARGDSPHTIAELFIEDQWRVADPLLGIVLTGADGRLATREMIAQQPALLTEDVHVQALHRFGSVRDFRETTDLYRYPPTIFNTWRARPRTWMERWPAPWVRRLVYAVQDIYLVLPVARGMSSAQQSLRRARHYVMLARWRSAERLCRRLLASPAAAQVGDDALRLLGRLYYAAGRQAEALTAFERLITDYPRSGWVPYAHAIIGRVHEHLGQPALALAAYQRSQLLSDDPVLAQRAAHLIAELQRQGSP